MGYIALAFFIIILLIYFLFTVSIVYHFKRYNISSRTTKKTMAVFLTVSVIFFIMNLILYSRIPWAEISQNIGQIFKSNLPF